MQGGGAAAGGSSAGAGSDVPAPVDDSSPRGIWKIHYDDTVSESKTIDAIEAEFGLPTGTYNAGSSKQADGDEAEYTAYWQPDPKNIQPEGGVDMDGDEEQGYSQPRRNGVPDGYRRWFKDEQLNAADEQMLNDRNLLDEAVPPPLPPAPATAPATPATAPAPAPAPQVQDAMEEDEQVCACLV